MFTFVLLAVLNGMFIGTSRVINSQLSNDIGPFRASFWNHIVGFFFITFTLLIISGFHYDSQGVTPMSSYLGGVAGALFVAVNSYVFQRLGAIKTVLLVISGQMISSVLMDSRVGNVVTTLTQLSGVGLILLGVYLAKVQNLPSKKTVESGGHA